MTHGTIHVIGDEMTVVLHTTHDGHTQEAFVDCAAMPAHVWRMLGGKNWWGAEFIKDAKKPNDLKEYMSGTIPLYTDVLTFSSWVVGMKCGFWFPMPHKGADEATLDYFGQNNPQVIVRLSDDRLPIITVEFSDNEEVDKEEWKDIKKTIKKRVGDQIKEYTFDDNLKTVSYCMDMVFAHMVHGAK